MATGVRDRARTMSGAPAADRSATGRCGHTFSGARRARRARRGGGAVAADEAAGMTIRAC